MSVNGCENEIIKNRVKAFLPFMLFFVNILFFHFKGYMLDSDDALRTRMLLPTVSDELANLSRTYAGRSSRYIIDPVIFLCLHMDVRVWLVLDSVIMTMVFWLLHHLFVGDYKEKSAWLSLPFILVFPLGLAFDVGWISTSVSYIWSLFFALLACLPVRRMYDGVRIGGLLWFASFFCCILACDKEEVSVGLFLLYLFVIVWEFKTEKKISPWMIVLMAVSFSRIMMHLFADGNKGRYIWSADSTRGFFDRIEIGISQSLQRFVIRFDPTFLVFVLMLALSVYAGGNLNRRIAVVCLTVLWILVSLVCGFVFQEALGIGMFDDYLVDDVVSVGEGKYSMVLTWVLLVVEICLWLAVFKGLCFCLKLRSAVFYIAIIFAAFAGRSVAGFAGAWPRLLDRTYIIAYVVLIGTSMKLAAEYADKNGKKQGFVELLLAFTLLGEIMNCIGLYIV